MYVVQSYLHVSHSSLKSDSLGLDLSGTARSGGALSTGREENVNYMLDLSDDEADVMTVLGANYKKILRLSYDVIITYDNRKSNLR